jgi:transposase-like protein
MESMRKSRLIERNVVPDSIVCSDCWKGYNVLDVSDFHHYRINHSQLFAGARNCPLSDKLGCLT